MSEERFSIIRTIRKGPNTSEYEAEDAQTGKSVNIRRCFLSAHAEEDTSWHEEFLELGKSLSELKHPNLLEVNEAGFDEDGPYISCELVKVKPILKEYPNGLENEIFFKAAEQVLTALAKIHQKELVHGAVVIDSLQVTKVSGEPQFLIYDLGMHWVKSSLRGEAYTYQDPIFTPPEFVERIQPNTQTDVYMFGHLLYCLWVGAHPLAGMDIAEAILSHRNHDFPMVHEIRKDVPLEWSKWIDRLTSPDLSYRPVDASAAILCMPRLKPKAAPVKPTTSAATPKLAAPSAASPALSPSQKPQLATGVAPAKTGLATGGLATPGQPFSGKSSVTPIRSPKSSGSGLLIGSIAALLILGGIVFFKFAGNQQPEETASNPTKAKPVKNPARGSNENAPKNTKINTNNEVGESSASAPSIAVQPDSPEPVTPARPDDVQTAKVKIMFAMSEKTAVAYRSSITIPVIPPGKGDSIIYPLESQGRSHIRSVSKIGRFNEGKLQWDFFTKDKLKTRTYCDELSGLNENDGWKIELVNPSSATQSYMANLYFLSSDTDMNLELKIGGKSVPFLIKSHGHRLQGRVIQLQLKEIPANTKMTLELTCQNFQDRPIASFAGCAIVIAK